MIEAISSINTGAGPMHSLAQGYNSARSEMYKSLLKMSSGMSIMKASDNPAGLAMSERLRAGIRGTEAAMSNIQNAVDYTRTADGWLQSIGNMMGRMGELAVLANDGTKSAVDRQALQAEFSQMQQGIQSITTGNSALGKFNGQPLFQGQEVIVQTGTGGQAMTLTPIDLTTGNTTSIGSTSSGTPVSWGGVITGGASISSMTAAAEAGQAVSIAGDYLGNIRATLGAEQNRLVESLQGMGSYQQNMISAEGRIRGVDYAAEMVNFMKYRAMGNTISGLINTTAGTVSAVG